jgi:hypothetical protein
MQRRTFLSTLGLAAAGLLPSAMRARVPGRADLEPETPDDRFIAAQLQRGSGEHLAERSIGELVVTMGRLFVGMPYKANTLEQPGDEHLVVNLREFDCVTLCENALALARTVTLRLTAPADFKRQLQQIRYRGGIIRGYQSRLHYFTGWVADNEAKGVVRDITRHCGGQRDFKDITFMSEHRTAYPRMADRDAFEAIREDERRLNAAERYVLPKAMVRQRLGSLRNGDVIGITTSIAGLDCSHTGIVVEVEGTVRLLHATLDGKQVTITPGTLTAYLDQHPRDTGIIVARPASV